MAVGTSLRGLLAFEGITLADIEAIRLILRGQSVVDWYRLNLNTAEEVECFLRVNGYDSRMEDDERRLRHLLASAIEYLETNFYYHFPDELKHPEAVTDVFLAASSSSEYQNLACIVLKVAHIINHIDARELRYRLPVSDDALFRRAEDAVTRTVEEMVAAGAPITTFTASRKSRDSLITKLLAKKSTIAAQVFDRLRFRIVTKTSVDLVPVLVRLKDRILPFNYVVPGQSRNEVLPTQAAIEAVPRLNPLAHQLQYQFQLQDAGEEEDWNRFSSSDFRMINFVVDMPLRVDEFVTDPALRDLGFLVFSLVEFQMFDEPTFEQNERGESSHDRYKDRQRWEVIRRLVYGGQFGVGRTR